MAEHRRRGQELVDDILQSTFELLQSTKFEDLTMDMIAKNAKTNKNVLYRRWDSKAELVIAAFRNQMQEFDLTAPNTGDLRTDLQELFGKFTALFGKMKFDNIESLIQARLGATTLNDIFVRIGRRNYLTKLLHEILEHANERGQIDMSRITDEMMDLPILLLLDLVFNNGMDSEHFNQIIDGILMPLYQPK